MSFPSLPKVSAGWLLYGQLPLMAECTKRWRLHLGMGFAVSLPLFFVALRYVDTGIVTQTYPILTSADIWDYPGLRRRMLSAKETEEAKSSPNRA